MGIKIAENARKPKQNPLVSAVKIECLINFPPASRKRRPIRTHSPTMEIKKTRKKTFLLFIVKGFWFMAVSMHFDKIPH